MAEKSLKENEILIGKKTYTLTTVKVKHMKAGFYGNYMSIRKYGIVRLLGFVDGEQILTDFMEAILENKESLQEVMEQLDAKSMKELLNKVKAMNELEDEDPNA